MNKLRKFTADKSDALSDRYREEGNKQFTQLNVAKSNLMPALWLYNKVKKIQSSRKIKNLN